MTLTEILMITATAISPLIAVQVTRRLDDRNEARGRKLHVFKTLMATRAYILSPAHVEALNRIDLEFSRRKPKEKVVLEIWQQYLDHLSSPQVEGPSWALKRIDLLVDLLYAMGTLLDYDFSKTQIKNGIYAPTAHSQTEEERDRLRRLVLEVLEGNRDLPMRVVNIPTQPLAEHQDR